MQSSLLFLSALSVAIFACSVHCMRPVFRLPRDAETTGRYIVVLNEDTSHHRFMEIVEMLRKFSNECKVYGYTEVTMKAIVVDISYNFLQKIRSMPEVLYIEEEGISYAAMSGIGSGYNGDIWYQDRIDQLPNEGEGVDVYILDTGIRFDHQEFEYRAKYGGYDPVDNYEYGLGVEDYVPMHGADCHGHGTAVASLVGGKVFGKAKKANLYSVRVIRCDTTAPWGIVLDGLEFVADVVSKRGKNAIVVLALSGMNSQLIIGAIDKLNTLTVIVVTAAGNDKTDACGISPANSPHAITVGATDRYDNALALSNYGPCVDLFAPGEDILAASNECDSCTNIMSGSTMSAAITAGVVAVYFSQFPHFTPALIKERLLYQCIPNVINLDSIPEDRRPETPNRILNRGCGGVIPVLAEKGIIQSPDFPQNYLNNMRCKWTLISQNCSENVRISFTHLILEEHYDKVMVCVKDVCNEDDKLVLTGDYGTPNCVLESDGQYMTIEMTTDSFTVAPGFRAIHSAHVASNGTLTNRCFGHSDSTIQLNVFSAGLNSGDRFSMQKGWSGYFEGRNPGINVAVIDEVNGSVIATESFNLRAGDSNKLGIFIEKIWYGQIVCVAISNDGITSLNDYAKRSLMWLGSIKIHQLVTYDSLALIGVKGLLSHTKAIEVAGNFPAELSTRVHLQSSYKYIFEITAESAGTHYGKYARITVNGTEVNVPYNGYDPGLHVVVVHEVTGLIIRSQVFDTSAESGAYSSSHQFVELINELSEGRIVAIAIKDDGIHALTEEAKVACESIGSTLIREVPIRVSWAIIGRKCAAKGSVAEAFRSTGVSRVKLVLPNLSDCDVPACPLVIKSLENTGIGNNISVNGTIITHPTPTTQGNLIALLTEGECSIEKNMSFTSSDKLADFMKHIPPGRTVMINIAYNYRSFSDYGNAALESIGSRLIRSGAFNDPWVIVGKKGTPIGSSIEDFYVGEGKAFAADIGVKRLDLAYLIVESADIDFGDYSKISVNGKTFIMDPVYECGLNVVVLEEKGSHVHYTQTFNMTDNTSQSNSDVEEFVKMTRSLVAGTIVVLGTNDAGGLEQSEEIQNAINELGSGYNMTQVTGGQSWGMIGRKGGPQGSALEILNSDGPIEIVSHIPGGSAPVVENDRICRISVESSATTSHLEGGLRITLNGQTVNTSLLSGVGIRVALVKQHSCELEYIASYRTYYNTHSDGLITWMNFVQPGRIVIAASFNLGNERRSYYYADNLKIAFESIGSSQFRRARYHDAWAIIGRKGAAIGSVPESLLRSLSDTVSPSVAVGGVMPLNEYNDCMDELYPLECLGGRIIN